MSEDEKFLFQQEVTGVKPLQVERRERLRGPATSADSVLHRRAAAVAQSDERNPLSDSDIAPLDAWYVLDFKRPGVQNGVYRKLKQGRYQVDAKLNLHRMGVELARREIFEFIAQAQAYGMRSVMIIHGKGQNSPGVEAASVIKGCVDHWLRQLEVVQAFHSAQIQHGGTGAIYVLLRKSEAARQTNRERYPDP